MSPAGVSGYAAMTLGQPLVPIEYPAPELGEHDIRVSVSHCGVCYTDVQGIDDFYGITAFPFVPGHEIVGHVEALGSGVCVLAEGDRVGIGWQGRACGRCEWCLTDEVQLCQDIADMGTWERHGGFSSSVTVDSRFAYPVPTAMPSDVAAVLMCAGVSVFTPLRTYASASRPHVAIHGIGGLGHLAIRFAHAFGCEVTVLSSSRAKAQEARAFGADHFVVTGDRDRMRPLDYAFELVLCTAHGAIDWEELLMTLRKRGRLVLVGFADMSIDPTDVVAHELTITGSFLGNHEAMLEMLSFAEVHGISPVVERLPMAQANEAIARLRDNRAHYRIVLEAGM